MNKITLTIRLDGPNTEQVACMDIETYKLFEAMQSIKTSDSGLGTIFDGQTASQQGDIMRSRDMLWRTVSRSMEQFFYEKVFTANDTHNGYTKREQ